MEKKLKYIQYPFYMNIWGVTHLLFFTFMFYINKLLNMYIKTNHWISLETFVLLIHQDSSSSTVFFNSFTGVFAYQIWRQRWRMAATGRNSQCSDCDLNDPEGSPIGFLPCGATVWSFGWQQTVKRTPQVNRQICHFLVQHVIPLLCIFDAMSSCLILIAIFLENKTFFFW